MADQDAPSVSSASLPSQGRRLPVLDGLRGVAILLVLMDHLFWSNSNPAGGRAIQLLARVRSAGWVGVDLFFVLSGFLITGILYDTLGQEHFFRNFYARRSLRIFPLYYGFLFVMTVIVTLMGWHWSPMIYRALSYTQNLSLGRLPEFTDAPWVNINHFWSLAVEEQFYLVWPLLIFLLKTRRRIALAAGCGVIASLLIRIMLIHSGVASQNIYVLYSWTPARLDSLLAGALLAILLRSRLSRQTLAAGPPVFCCCLVLWAAIAYLADGLDWQHHAFIATAGFSLLALTFAALIATALADHPLVSRPLSHALLRFFGRYSYGLYVYHLTLTSLIIPPLRRALLVRFYSKSLSVALPGLLALAATVSVAWLSYNLFEAKLLRLKVYFNDARPSPRPLPAATRDLRERVTEVA